MPLVKFIRGVVWNGEGQEIGAIHDVSPREAVLLCEGYKDAVRVDTAAPTIASMTVRDQITHADPVAAHRDPVGQPDKRKK